MDQFGGCYVANRNYGTVVKIGLIEAGQFIDRNGNSVPDTSYDVNGDGDITGSEILAWGQDECVLYEVVIIPGKEGTFAPNTFTGGYGAYSTAGARSLAAELEGNIWAGNFTAMRYYHIDGGTGQILRTNDLTAISHTPYGAIVDAHGILWSGSHYGHCPAGSHQQQGHQRGDWPRHLRPGPGSRGPSFHQRLVGVVTSRRVRG